MRETPLTTENGKETALTTEKRKETPLIVVNGVVC